MMFFRILGGDNMEGGRKEMKEGVLWKKVNFLKDFNWAF